MFDDLLGRSLLGKRSVDKQRRDERTNVGYRPIHREARVVLQAEECAHQRHQPLHELARACGGIIFRLRARHDPGGQERGSARQYRHKEPAVVAAGIQIQAGLHERVVGFRERVADRGKRVGAIRVLHKEAEIDELLQRLGVFSEIQELGQRFVRFAEKLRRGLYDGLEAVVGHPDIMDPEEAEAFEQLNARRLVVCKRVDQAHAHLAGPITERREEDKEQGQREQHRQAAAEHADVIRLHELLLLGVELLRVVCVLFAKLVELRLNRLHLDGGLAGFDVAKHRDGAHKHRRDDDR